MNKLTSSGFAIGLMMATLANSATLMKVHDESKSPLGCRDQGYQFKLNVLEIIPAALGDRQSLYFIFNRSNRPVSMVQMLADDSSRSMPLNHVINPQQWSVLATNQKEMKYICAMDPTPTRRGKIVNCSENVKVCEYARVKFGLNNRGNYWFLNSSSSSAAVSDVLHYGIIPR